MADDVTAHVCTWRFDLWFCRTCLAEITDEEIARWDTDA